VTIGTVVGERTAQKGGDGGKKEGKLGGKGEKRPEWDYTKIRTK